MGGDTEIGPFKALATSGYVIPDGRGSIVPGAPIKIAGTLYSRALAPWRVWFVCPGEGVTFIRQRAAK